MMRRRAMAARAAGTLARGGARAAGSSAAAAATSSSNEVRASPRHVPRFDRRRRRGLHLRRLSSLPAPSSSTTTTNSLPQQRPDDADLDATAHLHPIDFPSASQITGEESQILEVRLAPNQILRAESGAMLYMTRGVTMETSMGLGGTAAATGGGGALSAGLTRMMTGSNLMVSDFRYIPPAEGSSEGAQEEYGTVGLGTDFPAKILRFHLDDHPDATLICQKGAFLAGSPTIAMEMAYTKTFTGGFFGGEGFILQRLRGTSHNEGETAFVKAYGTVVRKELQRGETLRISSGSLVCMTSTVEYDVTTMPGFKNVMFGGEGLFVTTLTGPGTVWLQGMPVDRMVSEIARKVPGGGGIGLGIPIGMGGGGGGGEGAGDAEAADAGGGEGAGDADAGVPVTDAAVEAERNATVASSGLSSDPESSESLFGDAAYGGGGAPESNDATSFEGGGEGSSFSTEEFSDANESMNMPEFEEPVMDEPQFEDDGTTFSTYEGEGASGMEGAELPEDEGSGLLGQLWDMFKDFTDE